MSTLRYLPILVVIHLLCLPEPSAADSPGARAVEALAKYLDGKRDERAELQQQPFAVVSLTREEADRAQQLLWNDHAAWIRKSRAEEMERKELRDGDLAMPFFTAIFGEKPERGRSLFVSLHGGGGAPARVNDRQWENQKRLYQPAEGVYVAPRAPTNTWNLWHQPHIDRLFDRLIENLIVFEDVDPERIYLLGYSAGGDGVYQLAPRMADRWAGAAMMAGHPNDASPLGLRNTAFTLHVGGQDAAYNRNKVGQQWQAKLAKLREEDPDGYEHWAKVYPDKGHWLDREDAAALPWMAKFRRRTLPTRVVWQQDDITGSRFYWLAVTKAHQHARSNVVATREKQQIKLQADGVDEVIIRLNDKMLDLDKPVRVTVAGTTVHELVVPRTIAVIAETLRERGDPTSVFRADVTVDVAKAQRAASVQHLKRLKAVVYEKKGDVVELRANRVAIKDDDLRHLARFRSITDVSLEETTIGDAGLAHLRGLPELEWLNLYRTDVTDAGLEHLRHLPQLKLLPIGETQVTDAGLVHLSNATQLTYLGLRGNAITDAGLTHLSKLTKLTGLYLGETEITDEGLEQLLPLKQLRQLWLNKTAVSDEGVATLVQLQSLRELHVADSAITPAGIARLRRELPACKVHDTEP